ncbi:hypothetical protein RintRC_6867 [Richelia intracellularis]|nr:hypothetical protein RintRC_6867 [Richelia intracellularis]
MFYYPSTSSNTCLSYTPRLTKRVALKLYDAGLTEIFIRVALSAADRFGVKMDSFHLDSISFHVHGDYGTGTDDEASAKSGFITITYGYWALHKCGMN